MGRGVEQSERDATAGASVSGVGAGSASAEASVCEAGLAFGLLDLALDDLALVVGKLQHGEGDCASGSGGHGVETCEQKPTLPTATSILPEKVTKERANLVSVTRLWLLGSCGAIEARTSDLVSHGWLGRRVVTVVTVRASAGVVGRVGVSSVCDPGAKFSKRRQRQTRRQKAMDGMSRLTRSRTDTGAGDTRASSGTGVGTVSVRTVRAVGVRVYQWSKLVSFEGTTKGESEKAHHEFRSSSDRGRRHQEHGGRCARCDQRGDPCGRQCESSTRLRSQYRRWSKFRTLARASSPCSARCPEPSRRPCRRQRADQRRSWWSGASLFSMGWKRSA